MHKVVKGWVEGPEGLGRGGYGIGMGIRDGGTGYGMGIRDRDTG